MRLVAFLQLYNEVENGNLVRCLDNCKQWADDIFIYDDCSTDGSQGTYEQYTSKTNIIFGRERNFKRELFHKQQLLDLTLKSNPDWIGWIDGDTTLDRSLTNNCKDFLMKIDSQGYTSSKLHNLNLWKHPAFFRLDNKFNGLWHVVFWKNTGGLNYIPEERLHRQQFPDGMPIKEQYTPPESKPLLHYGFGSKFNIVKKYLTYKSYGQSGWSLDRLIDEQSSYQLEKVPKDWYPENNIPLDYDVISIPRQLTYNEYRKFNSWEEFKTSKEYQELIGIK
jgi:glycosyltransferase involved in cell wall biosynthesis